MSDLVGVDTKEIRKQSFFGQEIKEKEFNRPREGQKLNHYYDWYGGQFLKAFGEGKLSILISARGETAARWFVTFTFNDTALDFIWNWSIKVFLQLLWSGDFQRGNKKSLPVWKSPKTRSSGRQRVTRKISMFVCRCLRAHDCTIIHIRCFFP